MDGLVEFVQTELALRADPDRAPMMAAYLKTEMPLYGVGRSGWTEITRTFKKRFVPGTDDEYRGSVLALWNLPHREEKYLAIGLARTHPQFITLQHLPLYKQMVVEGAWWDLVDSIAARLVGKVVQDYRSEMALTLEEWIQHDDMWLRRTAIICQLHHKDQTDTDQLFDFCLRRAHEKEFFIRKAIGWALRQYARTDPAAVSEFLVEHRDELSGLSFREASKQLDL